MKYQKKPFVIEAYQTFEEKIIHTLEGDMKASVGDYILQVLKENSIHVSQIFLKNFILL